MDDEAPKNAPIRQNPKGLRVGYNPYESGMLAKKETKPSAICASYRSGSKRNASWTSPTKDESPGLARRFPQLLLMPAAEKTPQLREPRFRRAGGSAGISLRASGRIGPRVGSLPRSDA